MNIYKEYKTYKRNLNVYIIMYLWKVLSIINHIVDVSSQLLFLLLLNYVKYLNKMNYLWFI